MPITHPLPIAILAGGMARRTYPLTASIPKSMIFVAGEPFVAHQLRVLRREGLERVVFCLGYLGQQIQDYVGNGAAFGLHVDYSFDGPRLLGTGGALRRALPLLGDEFIQTYGDSYLDLDYGEVEASWHRTSAPALMTVFRNAGRWGASNAGFEAGWVTLYQKGTKDPRAVYIEFGLNVFRADVFRHAPAGAFDLGDLHGALARDGLLAGHEVKVRFYEIGTPEGLHECEEYILGNNAKRT